MAKKTEEKKQAYSLYVYGGLTLKEIGAITKVSQTTLSIWNNDENWEAQKAGQNVTREKLIQQYYVMLASINQAIVDAKGIPTAADADKIFKIQATISSLDKNYDLGSYYTVLRELIEYVNPINPDDAKKLGDYMLEFIKEKAKRLKK
jgi:hypothetical protein